MHTADCLNIIVQQTDSHKGCPLCQNAFFRALNEFRGQDEINVENLFVRYQIHRVYGWVGMGVRQSVSSNANACSMHGSSNGAARAARRLQYHTWFDFTVSEFSNELILEAIAEADSEPFSRASGTRGLQ